LSEGGSSMVRSIIAEIDPWGGADGSTVGATACTLDGGMTTPRSALTACSVGWSCCGCGSSHAGCDSGCAASFPASGGASTTSLDFLISAHPASRMDVLASAASTVA
jgi:hypothetical protein